MIKHYLLLLLLVTVIASCPGYHTGDLLESGKNVIMRTKPTTKKEFQYEVLISFPFPTKGVQVLATTSTIGGYNPLPTSGCNYILSASRKQNSNSIIYKLLINNDQSWTSMQVSYLVSGRDDIAIGNIQIPYSKFGRPAPNVYNIVHRIQKNLPSTNYKVAAFISGFSTTDSQFNVAINKRLFNYDTKEIVIGIYSSADPAILSFTLSYIVYPEVHPVLDISYSLEIQGEIGSYQVSGPVSFGVDKKIEYNQWIVGNRLLECQGNQCQNSCELKQSCLEKKGNVWEGKCTYCSPGVISQYGRCSKKCGANQVYINRVCQCLTGFTRKSKDCIKANLCGTNQIYDKVKGCVCKDKCAKIHGQCVECPSGSVPTNDGASCFCTSVNQIFNGVTHKCENRCLQNQIWNNNRCNCLPKHCWWNQACRLCPEGSDTTSDQSSCACRGPNSFYRAEQNKCVQCTGLMKLNDQRTGCVCKDGYGFAGSSCVIKCKQSQVLNAKTGGCDCKPGLERSNGQCKVPLKCGLNQQGDGKSCVCIKDHARYNGKCTKCPAGTLPNSLKTSCICTNPSQIFNFTTFACASCINNSSPSTDLTKCVCKNGYQLSNKQCILKCGLNEKANDNIGKCQCLFGYSRNAKDNTCQPRCQPKEQWNGNKCVCTAGNVLVKGVCKPCPTNSNANSARDRCICKVPNQIFDLNRFQCTACPLNTSPSPDHSICLCNKGYESKNGACLSVCNFDQTVNPKTGLCQCKYGFMQLGPMCVQRCGLNQEWTGKQCVCKNGNGKKNNVCMPCPTGSTTNSIRTKCICQNKKHYFNISKFNCQACPANSSPNSDFSDFVCFSGYKRDGLNCINNCPTGAIPNSAGQCICGGGLVLSDNSCKKPVICPKGSSWDQKTLECICDSKGLNLIDGICKTCGENSIFNKGLKKCICNTGFFSIAGVCQVCDARTSYNGTDCICNLGYFGDRNKCQKCHSTCSRCKGPEANQCLQCSDVSLILQKGFCSKNVPCEPGFFLDDVDCKKCSDNCIICKDLFKCQACAIGYDNEVSIIGQQKFDLCTQICGDGIRFQAECDDGNTDDNDGCSSKCTVEAGWTCQGGSSSRKSKCNKFIPDQTVLSSKGAVNLGDRVVQSVRATYLPKCLTNNECSKCFKVLKVNVLDAFVPVLVKVNFVPFSQYQFLIEYDFQGLIVTSRFKVVIKLNEQFKGCLADDDFNQQIELEIDPAFLAKIDEPQTLTLEDIADPQKIKVPKNAQSILGI